MTESPVTEILAGLNPAQRDAVTHEAGPLLVLAGAGTGKTTVVTSRVAWLIGQALAPERILLLTFTRRAAREMLALLNRARLVDSAYTTPLEIVDISGHKATIHEVLSLETVVGYLRVSTDEQARGYGLDVQRSKVREFAKQERLSVAGIFEDVGVPGSTPLLERKGLAAALDAVKAGKASALVVARHDRLARDTLEALLIERQFERAGARVLYGEGANGSEPSVQFLREVLHSAAAFEKRDLVARLAAARKAKAEQGGYAGGRPPFGYRADDGFLYPDEQAASVVRWIFELVANEGASIRGVCRALTRRDAGLRRWHPTQVERILRRDLYKRGPVGSRIVDPKVWNRAAGVLAARRPR